MNLINLNKGNKTISQKLIKNTYQSQFLCVFRVWPKFSH